MPEIDAQTLLETATLLGLMTSGQAQEVRTEAEDGSLESITRTLLRKGYLTSWQIERLKKGERSGLVFGGCKVLFHLAEGTFARVYRGQRIQGGQPIAVKVLRNRFVSEPGAITRFNREAEAGMKLRHPNIVQILDYGEEDRKYYMLMEYVEGSNLRDLLKIRKHIDSKTALPMMLGLARGLKYSFDHGVAHRDLKGTNVLVSSTGIAKLVDFGLATIEGDEKKAASINPRTVDYSALERACGSEKGDFRSDIFFLGCVFYQMLTGQPPMPETETKDMLQKMLKRSFGAIKPLSDHRYAPDEDLAQIVEKMMKVDLKARYQRIEDVIDDLEKYASRHALSAGIGKASGSLDGAEDEEIQFDKVQLFIDRTTETDEDKAEPEPVAAAAKPPEPVAAPAGAPKQVLCVESQREIQEAFRKALSRMGYRVALAGDAGGAAEQYRSSVPDAVIFDADGLGPEAVDAFLDMHGKAHQSGHELAALVLLSPKQEPLRAKLPAEGRVIVLAKPVKMKQVQEAIVQLVPTG